MKTISEVQRWCQGALIEYGDPSIPVGQIFAQFVRLKPLQLRNHPSADLITDYWNTEHIELRLDEEEWLPMPIDVSGPRIDQEGRLETFGIEMIMPGFWTLVPSLNLPGILHCFVHIYDVGAAAPWERRIVTPAEFAMEARL